MSCGFRIDAYLVKEGSFRINAKLVKGELNTIPKNPALPVIHKQIVHV